MIDAYEVGVSLVMSEAILDSLSAVNSSLLTVQQAIMGGNAALKRMDTLTRGATGSTNMLAAAWKSVAASAAAASAAAGKMGMGGFDGPAPFHSPGPSGSGDESPSSLTAGARAAAASASAARMDNAGGAGSADGLPQPFRPAGLLTYDKAAAVPLPVTPENLPAIIPGTRPQGPESWPTYKIPGYGDGGTPVWPDSSPTDYTPNWTFGREDQEDEDKDSEKSSGAGKRGAGKLGKSGSGMNDLFGAVIAASAVRAGMRLFGDSVNDAALMQQQIAIQQGAGIAANQIALNTKASWAAANGGVTDVSPQQAMATITMLRSLLGNSAAARAALDPVLKTEVGLQAALGPKAAESMVQALKALDISGGMVKGTHISVQKLIGLLPYIAQAMVQTHGVLTAAQLLRMMQQAGPAASATSFKNLIMHMAEITAAIGTGAGRGLFMAYMATSVGRISAVSAAYMERLGLLKPSQLHKVKGSSTYLFNPNDLYGAKYLQKNGLVDWIHNKIIPYLEKHGDNTPQEIIRDISGILPASTAARVVSYVINNYPQIARTQDNIEKGVKTHALYTSAQKTWKIQLQSFEKAWAGLLTSLGMPIIGTLTTALTGITDGIHKATEFFSAHPEIAKAIEAGLIAISVGVGVLAAVLIGPLIAAIIASGGTIAAVAAGVIFIVAIIVFNWKSIARFIEVSWRATIGFLESGWKKISNFFSSLWKHPLETFRHLSTAGKILVSVLAAMYAPITLIVAEIRALIAISPYLLNILSKIPALLEEVGDAMGRFFKKLWHFATHPWDLKSLVSGDSSSPGKISSLGFYPVPDGPGSMSYYPFPGEQPQPTIPATTKAPLIPALRLSTLPKLALATQLATAAITAPASAMTASNVTLPPSSSSVLVNATAPTPKLAGAAHLAPAAHPIVIATPHIATISTSVTKIVARTSAGSPLTKTVASVTPVAATAAPARSVAHSPASLVATAPPTVTQLSAPNVPVIASHVLSATSSTAHPKLGSPLTKVVERPVLHRLHALATGGSSRTLGVVPPPRSDPAATPVYVVGGSASVHVTNPGDIHNAVAQSFAQQLEGIQTGPTGHDSSFGLPTQAGAW